MNTQLYDFHAKQGLPWFETVSYNDPTTGLPYPNQTSATMEVRKGPDASYPLMAKLVDRTDEGASQVDYTSISGAWKISIAISAATMATLTPGQYWYAIVVYISGVPKEIMTGYFLVDYAVVQDYDNV